MTCWIFTTLKSRIDTYIVLYYIESWYLYSFLNSALFQKRFETSVSNIFLIIANRFNPLLFALWYYDCLVDNITYFASFEKAD